LIPKEQKGCALSSPFPVFPPKKQAFYIFKNSNQFTSLELASKFNLLKAQLKAQPFCSFGIKGVLGWF
jgi:hypothetical protein